MFVKVQMAVFAPTVAVTVNVPDVVLAVRVGATASPSWSVVADAVDKPPKVPPAPPDGTTVNVIVVFGAGFVKESVTWATRGNGNGVATTVLSGVPPTARMFAAVPGAMLKAALLPDWSPVASARSVYEPATDTLKPWNVAVPVASVGRTGGVAPGFGGLS
jgi:hypothetical protein